MYVGEMCAICLHKSTKISVGRQPRLINSSLVYSVICKVYIIFHREGLASIKYI